MVVVRLAVWLYGCIAAQNKAKIDWLAEESSPYICMVYVRSLMFGNIE